MDENERRFRIVNALWWWLPARWEHDGSLYEILRFELTGDAEVGGVDLYVTKNAGEEALVNFTNEECYGEGTQLQPDDARTRIYTEVL